VQYAALFYAKSPSELVTRLQTECFPRSNVTLRAQVGPTGTGEVLLLVKTPEELRPAVARVKEFLWDAGALHELTWIDS
jgi:hypothetical protein